MPAKTEFTSEQRIRAAVLPTHGKTYTVIPHGYIIDETRKELSAAGFSIKEELYKTNLNAEIAQGIYHLNYGNDPDMGLMFAWSNSYNKTMSFKCAVGARVFICMNGVVSGELHNFKRKHTGSALMDITECIAYQITNAKDHFETLVHDKEMLKNVILSPANKGTILGRLFAEQEILTLTQVGQVKKEMDNPSHNYNADPNSAWTMYNHITLALKESHPRTFLTDHQAVHSFFIDEYGQLNAPQLSNSLITNYSTQTIVEQDQLVLEDEYGVTFL